MFCVKGIGKDHAKFSPVGEYALNLHMLLEVCVCVHIVCVCVWLAEEGGGDGERKREAKRHPFCMIPSLSAH